MSLVTKRLILRAWRDTDLEPFARLNADPVVMELMGRSLTRDESDAFAARIRADMAARGWGLWALELKPGEDAGRNAAESTERAAGVPFAGCVGLSVPGFDAHFTPCVEIGWRLAKEHWGRGYASEAAAEKPAIRVRDVDASTNRVVHDVIEQTLNPRDGKDWHDARSRRRF